MKKRIQSLLTALIVLLSFILSTLTGCTNAAADEVVSVGDFLVLMASEYGMQETTVDVPLIDGISENDKYFELVQMMAMREIIPVDYVGLDTAATITKEFAAMALANSLYTTETSTLTFTDESEIAYPEAAKLAVDKGITTADGGKFDPKKELSAEECVEMVEKALTAKDNIAIVPQCEVVWSEGVHDFSADEAAFDAANQEIIVPATQDVKEGDSVIVKSGNSMIALKATNVEKTADGKLKIQTAQQTGSFFELYDKIDVEEAIDVDFNNAIIRDAEGNIVYDGTSGNETLADNVSYSSTLFEENDESDLLVRNCAFPADNAYLLAYCKKYEGKIKDYGSYTVNYDNSGITVDTKMTFGKDKNAVFTASAGVKDIGVDFKYHGNNIDDYSGNNWWSKLKGKAKLAGAVTDDLWNRRISQASATFRYETYFDANLKVKPLGGDSKSFNVGTVTVFTLYGLLSLDIDVDIIVSVTGEITVALSNKKSTTVEVTNNQLSLRSTDVKTASFEAQVDISVVAQPSIIIKVVGFNVVDAAIGVGAGATMNVLTTYSSEDTSDNGIVCVDIGAYWIIYVTACSDDSVIGQVVGSAPFRQDFMSKDIDSYSIFHKHFENGTEVPECTRGTHEQKEEDPVDAILLSSYTYICNKGKSDSIKILSLPKGYTMADIVVSCDKTDILKLSTPAAATDGSTLANLKAELANLFKTAKSLVKFAGGTIAFEGSDIGVASVTIKTRDGKYNAACTVVVGGDGENAVQEEYKSSFELDKISVSVNKGESKQISVTSLPDGYSESDLIWTSSDNGIATVSAGTVTGVSGGVATITCATSDGKYSTSCSAMVIASVSEMEYIIFDEALMNELVIAAA